MSSIYKITPAENQEEDIFPKKIKSKILFFKIKSIINIIVRFGVLPLLQNCPTSFLPLTSAKKGDKLNINQKLPISAVRLLPFFPLCLKKALWIKHEEQTEVMAESSPQYSSAPPPPALKLSSLIWAIAPGVLQETRKNASKLRKPIKHKNIQTNALLTRASLACLASSSSWKRRLSSSSLARSASSRSCFSLANLWFSIWK